MPTTTEPRVVPVNGACVDIDTAALAANLATLQSQTPAQLMAVIKANAYGHGLIESATALAAADAFAVAHIQEAQQLRAAGVRQAITVFSGTLSVEDFHLCERLQLSPVLYSPAQIQAFNQAGVRLPHAWLKVDTGMHRLGFSAPDLNGAKTALSQVDEIGLMSHMADADRRESDHNTRQRQAFQVLASDHSGPASLANSAALLNWPDSHYDWVRPGIALYGASPLAGRTALELALRPAMHFYSHIIAEREIEPGETVGYNGAWRAGRASRIAVVAAGYADGYPRHAPNGTPVAIGDATAPLVGAVSMDMLTIDITDLPGVGIGSRVSLWGGALPVEQVAQHAGTISYELLCAVSERVQRRWL